MATIASPISPAPRAAVPLSVLAFAVGGVALMGVLPSGAYLAKKLLLEAADGSGQWWWEWVLQAGGFLTTSYVVLVIAHALRTATRRTCRASRCLACRKWPRWRWRCVRWRLRWPRSSGRCPRELLGNPLAPKELGWTLVTRRRRQRACAHARAPACRYSRQACVAVVLPAAPRDARDRPRPRAHRSACCGSGPWRDCRCSCWRCCSGSPCEGTDKPPDMCDRAEVTDESGGVRWGFGEDAGA